MVLPECVSSQNQIPTTLQQTIAFSNISGLHPKELCEVSKYNQFGYGNWTLGPGLMSDLRTDLMPKDYVASKSKIKKLLSFFAITDIHITDKESPSQMIFLQQLSNLSAQLTSAYSPVMLYTTHVLDAAIQTINALHKQNPIDFGISLGDASNSTQHNELRWYIDVLDGNLIIPSSGAHIGADTIDYQKPYKAAGLDPEIPWYQVIGNHDHFWLGTLVVDDFLRQSYTSDTVLAIGDLIENSDNLYSPDYYVGVIDGSTPFGNIIDKGLYGFFSQPPKVIADPDRRSLSQAEWMNEFFNTSSQPVGHGFQLTDAKNGFANYSFVPKSTVPIKVIVLDDTQRDDDDSLNFHSKGFLDKERFSWLKKELDEGQAAGQLMIIAAHIPIGVEKPNSECGWYDHATNGITQAELLNELQSHTNLILWIAGHRHCNTIKAFQFPDHPENSFWQVETSSLRDFPQQFRMFDIYLNSDYTISIITINVDPVIQDEKPAAISRSFAVATQQIVQNTVIYQNPSTLPDPTIKPMPTGSYNAELVKQLSPDMKAKMQQLY